MIRSETMILKKIVDALMSQKAAARAEAALCLANLFLNATFDAAMAERVHAVNLLGAINELLVTL